MAYSTNKLPGYSYGYYDGSVINKPWPKTRKYYKKCFNERDTIVRGYSQLTELDESASTLELARIETHYATFYRFTQREYWKTGAHFPVNWEDADYKRSVNQRYSPIGTVGHYLGLSYDAALDEIHFYEGEEIDTKKYTFVAIDACFTNILYLANENVLFEIWEILGLPQKSNPIDMFLDIMCPDTANEITNSIGLWARDNNYDGIIYPSARYGQRLDRTELIAEGKIPFPVINYVSVACLYDRNILIPSLSRAYWDMCMDEKGIPHEQWVPLYAELNLVLFSGKQLTGEERAVFYQCSSNRRIADIIVKQDARQSSKQWVVYT